MRSAHEKMAHPPKPFIKVVTESRSASAPVGKMLIPSPMTIDEYVRKIKKGQVITITQLREGLARQFNADYSCPFTTGLFLRIVADNAEEERANGKKRIAPYWRVLTRERAMNPKFPGGAKAHAKLLRAEGHEIASRGEKLVWVKPTK